MREIIIDSFAGGGGASEGIRAAIGRDPDIAVNHDRMALAMHRMNHPGTHHLEEDVVTVDAKTMCNGRPIGMLWMSPDCKHHSKAKGGKPRDKNIRGLAWTVFGWVKRLPKWQRPRVVFLENVEEFQDWGALDEDGMPCPIQKGAIFREFVKSWQALGYVVEFRELRACDYGVPTIRKRLYMVMRRDGKAIVWPTPTHGAPDSEGVRAGRLLPFRTAAEIIDWSLPCPSIFDSSEEIKRRFGIRANRPLADATMARIAKGTMRYVVNAARPFIVRTDMTSAFRRNGVHSADVPLNTMTTGGSFAVVEPHLVQVNHGGGAGGRDHALDEPLPTMTTGRGEALVAPFVSHAQQGGRSRPADAPLHTLTASPKDQDQVVAPFVTKFNTGSTGHSAGEPLHTVTAHASDTHGGGAAPLGVVAAHLMTMRNADKPHTAPDEPTHTVTAEGAGLGLVSAFLTPRYGEREGQEPRALPIDAPMPTIVPDGNGASLAAVHLSRQYGKSVGAGADEPVGTITAGGAGKAAVVAAFLAQHNSERDGGIKAGSDVAEPLRTVTASGGQQTLVAAHLTHAYTSNTRGGEGDPAKPIKTIVAGGQHAAAVYAFLAKYYGEGLPSQSVEEPIHTITAKPRHGLVTVQVEGEPYVIVDIGMRMLTPRERFNAQGFRPDYVIDTGLLEDGSTIAFTLEQQGRFCGNSVCPGMAEMLVRANYAEQLRAAPAPADDAGTLFREAAE